MELLLDNVFSINIDEENNTIEYTEGDNDNKKNLNIN